MNSNELALVAVIACFLFLSISTVSLRCYVRATLTKGFGADDALSVASLALFLVGSVCLLIGVGVGSIGQTWTSLSPSTLETGLEFLYIYELIYVVTTCIIKVSIGLFLLRFTVERIYIGIIYTVLCVLCTFSIFLFFFALFQCKPVSAFWNPQHGTCNSSGSVKVTYVHSAIVSASDWILGILPLFIVYTLNLGLRTKLYIGLLLAFGSFASIATLARFVYVKYLRDPKILLEKTAFLIASHLETGIALSASSAATLRPLLLSLKRVFRRPSQAPGDGDGDRQRGEDPLNNPVVTETGTVERQFPVHTDEIDAELAALDSSAWDRQSVVAASGSLAH